MKSRKAILFIVSAFISLIFLFLLSRFGGNYIYNVSDSVKTNFFIILTTVAMMIVFSYSSACFLMIFLYGESWKGVSFFDHGELISVNSKKNVSRDDDYEIDADSLKSKTFRFSFVLTVFLILSGFFANFLSGNVLFNLKSVKFDTIMRSDNKVAKIKIVNDILNLKQIAFIKHYSLKMGDWYAHEPDKDVRRKLLFGIAGFCRRMKISTLMQQSTGNFKSREELCLLSLRKKYSDFLLDRFKHGNFDEKIASFFGMCWLEPDIAVHSANIYMQSTSPDLKLLQHIVYSLTFTGYIAALKIIFTVINKYASQKNKELVVYSIFAMGKLFTFFSSDDEAKNKNLLKEKNKIVKKIIALNNIDMLCSLADALSLIRDVAHTDDLITMLSNKAHWTAKCKRYEYKNDFGQHFLIMSSEFLSVKILQAMAGIIVKNQKLISFLKKLRQNSEISGDMKKTIGEILHLLSVRK